MLTYMMLLTVINKLMGIYPRKYNKETFLMFLKKYNVSDSTLNKFNKLPETVERSGDIFKLDINGTWYNDNNTYYQFEINYYSEDLIEYLFSSKVFNDIDASINFLNCELVTKKYIK